MRQFWRCNFGDGHFLFQEIFQFNFMNSFKTIYRSVKFRIWRVIENNFSLPPPKIDFTQRKLSQKNYDHFKHANEAHKKYMDLLKSYRRKGNIFLSIENIKFLQKRELYCQQKLFYNNK